MITNKNKAVITILGLAGGTIYKDEKGNIIPKNFNSKHTYYYHKNKNHKREYANMLSLLIDDYHDEYKIVPLFTKEAKMVQEKILKETEDKEEFCNIFDDRYFIEDENDFDSILSLVDRTIEKFDTVIIDVTHGFRHLPILVTINLIMQKIKNNEKIEHIWFAKEKIKPEKDVKPGLYEIIDLKDYLELAKLSFVITNFKDNFTISSSIKVEEGKYKDLLKTMTNFSRDIMALSLHNLFHHTYPALISAIEELEDNFLLENDLKQLKEELKVFDHTNQKRYEIYFKLSSHLINKEYLLQSVALISEAKGFFLLHLFKNSDEKVHKYIENIESKLPIKDGYFRLIMDCKKIYSHTDPDIKKLNILKDKEIIELIKNKIGFNKKFKNFILKDLRNTLAHADTIKNIEDAKKEIEKEIEELNSYINQKR